MESWNSELISFSAALRQHTRLTRYYIRPFQCDSCYSALTTYYDFVLLYQYFNAKSTSMFDTICFGCITICVKEVWVSCIPHFRYSAIFYMDSFLILERARRRKISYLEEELCWKVLSPQSDIHNKPVGFLLLRHSVLFTVESLSLLYLFVVS